MADNTIPQGVTFDQAPAPQTPVPTGVTFDQNPQGISPEDKAKNAKNVEETANPSGLMDKAQQAIGNAVPQGAVPALEAAKKYLVDPFEQLASWGHEYGSKHMESAVAHAVEHPVDAVVHPFDSFIFGSEEDVAKLNKEHAIVAGVARGVGGTSGSIISDPRNWPLMGASEAMPVLDSLMKGPFAIQMTYGAHEAIKNLRENWDKMSTGERSEAITNAGLQTAMAEESLRHATVRKAVAQNIVDHVKNNLGTVEKTTSQGDKIPVQNPSLAGKAARQAVSPGVVENIAQEKTAPAVKQAVGDIVKKATGSRADTEIDGQGDSFGLRNHSSDLKSQATPSWNYIDKLSDNKFTDAQKKIEKGYALHDTDLISEGKKEKKILMDTFREDLKDKGLDIDLADRQYRRGIQVGKIADAFERTIDPDTGTFSGKKLSSEIGKLVAKGPKSPFVSGDFTPDHIASLKEVATIMKGQESAPPAFVKGLIKTTAGLFGFFHGSLATGFGAVMGESAAEKATTFLADRFLAQAMSDPAAAKELPAALRTGNTQAVVNAVKKSNPGWFSQAKNNLFKSLGNQRGAVGASIDTSEEPQTPGIRRGKANHSQELRDFSHEHTGHELDTEKAWPDERGPKIADAYDAMKHDPGDPAVRKSYKALTDETKDQWKGLEARGYTMSTSPENPYKSAQDMLKDIRDNKHITVWEGGQPPMDHPMSETDPETGVSNNTLFRAVHDILGHGKEGNDFSEAGEENAFRQHSQMYSPEAQGALATETKGQASWVFNHEGVRNGSSMPGDTFPEQKAALLPQEFHGTTDPDKVLSHIKADKPFAILTAENPMNERLSDAENKTLNEQMIKELREKGYRPVPVDGVNKDVQGKKEHAFFVPEISAQEAAQVGRNWDQASVLTQEGLHDLKKDTVNPSNNKGLLTSKEAEAEPYYSVVNGKPFAVPLDFEKEVPAGQAEDDIQTAHRGGGHGGDQTEIRQNALANIERRIKFGDPEDRIQAVQDRTNLIDRMEGGVAKESDIEARAQTAKTRKMSQPRGEFKQETSTRKNLNLTPEDFLAARKSQRIKAGGLENQTVGSEASSKSDTENWNQAKEELGPKASFSEIATRAQEIKTGEGPKSPGVSSRISGDVANLEMLHVPKEQRGQGEGTTRYQQWEKLLPKNVKMVKIHAADTGAGNTAPFWEKQGFQYVNEEKTGEPSDNDMWKAVNGNKLPNTPVTVNASGDSSASLEAQHRLQSQQAAGTKVYDVDSRMANSSAAWHPVMDSVDRVDQTPQPFHHLVTLDKNGEIVNVDSGRGAKPLPPQDRIQSLLDMATETRRGEAMAKSEIATRYPSSTKADVTNNPAMTTGLDAVEQADKISPARSTQGGKPVLGVKQKLVAALEDYRDNGLKFTAEDLANPDKALNKAVGHVAGNLEWLHNNMPESIRAQARHWYESAHDLTKKWADQYGVSHEQAAAVVAALSPKNAWDNNVGQAERLMQHFTEDQQHAWTPEMDNAALKIRNSDAVNPAFGRMINDIRGKTLDQLKAKTPEALLAKQAIWYRILDEAHGSKSTPNYAPDGSVRGSSTMNWGQVEPVAKALSILGNGDLQHIHEVMGQGHKIRNFYNNIINPWSERGHTTIDTHAVGAGYLKPFSQEDTEVAHNFGSGNKKGTPSPPKHAETGLKGMYPVYEEAYKQAARKLGLQPRELQSITWEGIRSLMGDDKKTPELRRAVTDIWRAHEFGHLTLDEARQEIVKASGGFSKPGWMKDEDWEGPTEQGNTSFDFGDAQ